MFTQRHTAHKVVIKDLLENDYVQREGESDFIMIGENQVSRVRVMATIVNKFINDERKSGTLIIDDGSDTINVRAWENEYHLIDKSVIGQLVDIVARVRMYNDQVYLTPEIIKKVGPNWFVLRKAELGKKPGLKVNEVKEEKKEENKEANELKDKILEAIKKGKDKTKTMEELTKIAGDKNTCKEILKQLLEDDIIFEPRAGKYKLLD